MRDAWSGRVSEEAVRAALVAAGLAAHAEGIVSLLLPSVRLVPSVVEPVAAPVFRRSSRVAGVGGVVGVAAGADHMVAVRADGSVLAWGRNDVGQLGDGTTTHRSAPVPVRDVEGAVAVAAGSNHSLALLEDGSVRAWGANRLFQLGDGTRSARRVPVPVMMVEDAVAVAAGGERSMVVTAAGIVWDLGASAEGASPEPPAFDHLTPRPVQQPGPPVVAVAIGRAHRVELRADGTVAGGGFNWSGERGDGEIGGDPVLVGVAVPGLSQITAVAAGTDHSLAADAGGGLWAWGANLFGQLGDGTKQDRHSPVRVTGLPGPVVEVAAGYSQSFALLADGSVWSWGMGFDGRLGTGDEQKRVVPGRVEGVTDAIAVTPRAAVRRDGTVVTWGGRDPAAGWGADAALPSGGSKVGGRPDLPAGNSWPRARRQPLRFLAQIDLASVPAPHRGVLPDAGLLSFFCAPTPEMQPGRVLFTQPGVALQRTDYPSSVLADDRLDPVALQAEAGLSLAPQESTALAPLGLSDEQRMRYGDVVEALTRPQAPLHRMFGYPDEPDGDEPEDAILLLQLDSDPRTNMEWGDLGRLRFWIQPDDLAAHRFDRAWLHYSS